MNVTDVYIKKQYTCKKCNGQVYYGKVTDDQGKIVTEDGAVPNGKFGKESNVLSGAVDANDKTKFHECYLSNLQQKYRDATNKPREFKITPNLLTTNSNTVVDDFISEANNFYMRNGPTAAKFCGAGATSKDQHITSMGMMHDYFTYRLIVAIEKLSKKD